MDKPDKMKYNDWPKKIHRRKLVNFVNSIFTLDDMYEKRLSVEIMNRLFFLICSLTKGAASCILWGRHYTILAILGGYIMDIIYYEMSIFPLFFHNTYSIRTEETSFKRKRECYNGDADNWKKKKEWQILKEGEIRQLASYLYYIYILFAYKIWFDFFFPSHIYVKNNEQYKKILE